MMNNSNENISEQIKNNVDLYAREIIELHYKIQPELIIKYNEIQKEKFLDYIKSNLNFFEASISVDSRELYFNYIKFKRLVTEL